MPLHVCVRERLIASQGDSIIIIPILQMGKLRQRAVEQLAWCYLKKGPGFKP